jgi:hypothetical protein
VSAVVFAAVPPDGSMILLYDELYIRQCNATLFAEKFAESVKGQTFYQWIIDMHGGRIRDIGTGRQVVEQYMVALRQYGVRSLTTGAGFMAGCDDIEARTASVRTAMHIRPTGTPKLRILRGSCPNLERELKRYRKKVVFQNGLSIVTDTPNTKGECHAVQCMEYIIASEPKYHAIKKRDEDNQTPEWIMKYMERRSRNRTPGVVYLGPQSNMTSGDMEGISNDAASWM